MVEVTVPTPRRDAFGLDFKGVAASVSLAAAVALEGLMGASSVVPPVSLPWCDSMEKAVKTSAVASALLAAAVVAGEGAVETLFLAVVGGVCRTGITIFTPLEGFLLVVLLLVGVDGAGREAAGEDGGVPNNPNNLSVAGALVRRCAGGEVAAAAVVVLAVVVVVVVVDAVAEVVGVASPFSLAVLPGDAEGLTDSPAKRSDMTVMLWRCFSHLFRFCFVLRGVCPTVSYS